MDNDVICDVITCMLTKGVNVSEKLIDKFDEILMLAMITTEIKLSKYSHQSSKYRED